MTVILDGRKLAQKLDEDLYKKVENLRKRGVEPSLSVVMVGNHPPSALYVRRKEEACKRLNIKSTVHRIDELDWEESLVAKINSLNLDDRVHGILVQMPIPKDPLSFLNMIDPKKDVDGLTPTNLSKLFLGQEALYPCTPLGCISLLKESGVKLEGANVIVIGKSILVGRSLAVLLMHMGATVTIAHSKTKDLDQNVQRQDIVISATGKQNLITSVKRGAIVIDVGIVTNSMGKLTGDVDFEKVSKLASYITPVPGGVGPMTVHHLTANLVKACEALNK